MEQSPLTPELILTREFSVGVRGYVRSEVDAFLRAVAMELAQRDRRIADLEASLAEHSERFAILERKLVDREARLGSLMGILAHELDTLDGRFGEVEQQLGDVRRLLRTWLVEAVGHSPVEVGRGQEEVTPPEPIPETLPPREHAEARRTVSPVAGGRSRAVDPRVLRVVERILGRTTPGDQPG